MTQQEKGVGSELFYSLFSLVKFRQVQSSVNSVSLEWQSHILSSKIA